MRFLTFTTLYPNSVQKTHGLFVEHRLTQYLRANPESETRVIAPVPWFPFKSKLFGRYAEYASVDRREHRSGIEVLHPRFVSLPKLGMSISPYLIARSCRATIRRMIASGWDFQLIDAHYFYPDGVAAAILGKWFDKPVVITARGTDINLFPNYRLPRRLIAWAAGESCQVITVSEALRQRLIDLGVDPAKIRTLRNGVDLEKFRPEDRRQARQRLAIPQDRTVLLSVGNLVPLKGHHLILEALPKLKDDVLLLIAGDGESRAGLEKLSRSMGVADRVRFCGSVDQAELPWYYSAADATLLASSREGLPNVVLESLACGTPVVSTSVGGVPEVIRSEVSGRLVERREPSSIADAVTAVLDAAASPASVRAYAEQFSWDATSKGQAEVFNFVATAGQHE